MRRALGLGLLMLWMASPAPAEVRRLEVVGVVPAGADARPGAPARQAALDAALTQAVERVARELLSNDTAADPDLDLRRVLGGKPREFTVGYKVLEDRGERRALLLADPEISTEYVLLVEVFVDVTRIESALDAAGLLLAAPVGGTGQELWLVVERLPSYRAYQTLRRHLMEQAGATSVIPAVFDSGRVAQNIMLAAAAIGVASCPITLHRSDDVAEVLGLGQERSCRYAVTLGYPAEEAAPKRKGGRKPLDELVHWDRY
jgi:nitroreductase